MPSVYIETTIPSYYYETRSDPRVVAWRDAIREWWDRHRFIYDLHVSRFVLRELGAAPAPKSQQTSSLVQDVQVLPEPLGLSDVIEFYIQHRLMPEDALGDAAHLAMASLHSMDFLLTWNCQHLANANKMRHIGVLNGRLGLPTPNVTTPLNLIPEGDRR